MQIVITISEDDYRKVQDGRESVSMMRKAIRNGTPLPKGHGRILDEKDILDTENNDGGWYDLFDMPEYIAGVKAIIEADKQYEAKVITRGNCMMCGKELTEGLFFCPKCEAKQKVRSQMPHSLRARLSCLRHKKIISDKDYERLCKALDNENVFDKIKTEIEQNAYPIVHGVNNHEKGMTLYGILHVINKYKAESEDKK